MSEVDRLRSALKEAMEWDWVTCPEGVPEDVVNRCNAALFVTHKEMLESELLRHIEELGSVIEDLREGR